VVVEELVLLEEEVPVVIVLHFQAEQKLH